MYTIKFQELDMKTKFRYPCVRYLLVTILIILGVCIDYGCCPLVPSLYIGTPDVLYLGKKDYDENANPRSYVFNASITQIKNVLGKISKKHNHERLSYHAYEMSAGISFDGYFDKQGNENDVCIEVLDRGTPFDRSEIYYSFSGDLNYNILFCCHLTQVDQSKTKVEIIILKEEVFLGQCFSLHVLRLVNNLVTVKPTSIEAYKILLEIGRELNETSMPQLKLTN
jgi:hypothetical protein